MNNTQLEYFNGKLRFVPKGISISLETNELSEVKKLRKMAEMAGGDSITIAVTGTLTGKNNRTAELLNRTVSYIGNRYMRIPGSPVDVRPVVSLAGKKCLFTVSFFETNCHFEIK